MTNDDKKRCTTTCWGLSFVAGLITALVLWLMRDWMFMQAAFLGALVFLVGGLLTSWLFCKPLPDVDHARSQDLAGDAEAKAQARKDAAAATVAGSAAATAAVAATASAKVAHAAEIKPTQTLKGQDELAASKGDWKYEAPAKPAAKKAPAKKAAPKVAAKAAPTKAVTAKAAPKPKAAAKPKAAPKPKAAAKPKATASTKPKAAPKPKAAAKPKVAAAPKAKAAPARKPVSATGKPEMLKKARAGGADDLKQIKGVGPKMEVMLNGMGVYHFDQVAGWRKKEVEWVDDNLEGFKGRVTRDDWVPQARVLAKGGQTEFAKKVKKGGVY